MVDRILAAKARDAEADTSALEREIDQLVYRVNSYPFNVTAQLSAFISVEFALRLKAADAKTPFARLLKRAVDAGRASTQSEVGC